MKKKSIILLLLLLFCLTLFAHKQDMHQHITREAFSLLKRSFPTGFTGLDEMEQHLGYDEVNNTSLDFLSIGDFKIVAGAWNEDEYDIVHHYGIPRSPDYFDDGQNALINLFVSADDNRKMHTSVSHFWNANSGENSYVTLSDEILHPLYQGYFLFSIPENAMLKMRKYISGNYIERRLHNFLLQFGGNMTILQVE